MDAIPLWGDLYEVIQELKGVALTRIPDGSGSSHFDGPEGWIHGLSMARVDTTEVPVLARAIMGLSWNGPYGAIQQIMVNNLDPGSVLEPHKDGEPNHTRFHLPVLTHPDVYWWDEINGRFHMEAGYWYGPVPYCGIMHSAGNPSPENRLHVVVDFGNLTEFEVPNAKNV